MNLIASRTMSEKIPSFEENSPTSPVEQLDKATKENFEEELSPEVIEKIMEKVQDIDTEGTAYHAVMHEKLGSILRDGLLGRGFQSGDEREVSKERWTKTIRERNKFVHFNIVGRARGLNDSDISNDMQKHSQRREIARSYYMRHGGMALVFDISSYKEAVPEFPANKGKSKTFHSHDPYFKQNYKKEGTRTKEGLSIPDSEYGFVLSHRVAPRFFRGIVFDAIRKLTGEEVEERLEGERQSHANYIKSFNENIKLAPFNEEKTREQLKATMIRDKNSESEQVKQIVVIMREAYEGKENLLLPVYDDYGSLLWPKKMTYEEVKKLVAEQEEHKNEKK